MPPERVAHRMYCDCEREGRGRARRSEKAWDGHAWDIRSEGDGHREDTCRHAEVNDIGDAWRLGETHGDSVRCMEIP